MGLFDESVKNEIGKKDNKSELVITKENILEDIEKYHSLLPDDIYEAIKGDPELMAEVIMLLLKKKEEGSGGGDARTIYRERQVSRGRSI